MTEFIVKFGVKRQRPSQRLIIGLLILKGEKRIRVWGELVGLGKCLSSGLMPMRTASRNHLLCSGTSAMHIWSFRHAFLDEDECSGLLEL